VSEPVVVLGSERGTGKIYALRQEAFRRGLHILGSIGAGKTSLLLRYLYATGTRFPFVVHDFIGNGHRHLETWIANLATMLAVAERQCPELAGSAARFLSRYAFLTIGDPNPAVRFDLLRRRTLLNGSRETVRDVTGRSLEVFFTKLNDPDAAQRVRFRRIATAILACLVAAERPVTEALFVLDDPMYLAFLERELAARRFRRSDHRFLSHQLAELHHVLALRPTDPTKSWRAFEDMTESTRNSMSDFAPGTLLGEMFGAETFPLEEVAFGRTSLSVTTRHADDTLKSQAFQALHAMLHGLFIHRQDFAGAIPLTYILDEPRWVRRNFPGVLAVSRNLGVSYAIAHQSLAQFEDIGLPTMARQLRALTNMQIAFRPTCFEDAEDEILHTHPIQPDGLVQHFTTSSWSDGSSDSSSVRSSWESAFRVFGSGGDFTDTSGTSFHFGEHETLNIVGFQDQVRYHAQSILWRPRFTGSVTLDGVGTEVAFAPAPMFPAVLAGVPILSLFRAWHDRHWWSRLLPRTSYQPFGTIVLRGRADAPSQTRSDPEESLPVGGATGMVTAQADDSPAASHTPEVRDEERAPEPPAPARQPVAPPTFGPRGGGAPSSRPPGNRRKRRGRGRAR
jgi:hypothetical protein